MKQFEKHLTLHLYRKDEVVGALRWALINRNIFESIYWGLELFDSDMEQDALEMIQCIWITEIGFGSVSLLSHILDIYKTGELDRDSLISLLYSISQIRYRDSTLLYLLIRGATTPIDWSPKFHHSRTYTDIPGAVEDCLYRGKLLEAWYLARALNSENQWLILNKLIHRYPQRKEFLVKLRDSNLSDLIQRLVAFVLASLQDPLWQMCPLIERELPSEVKTAIDEWDAEDSLRKRRIYKIRPEALLYLTERSQQSQTLSSESDIQENLIQSLLESPYWSGILDDYMTDNDWTSDLYKEMFYDNYFDDIPDEWSSEDREKSHGRGLARTPEVGLTRFLDALFQRSKTLEIWNYEKIEVYIDPCSWDSLYDEFQEKCQKSLESQLPLEAIKKTFEIV